MKKLLCIILLVALFACSNDSEQADAPKQQSVAASQDCDPGLSYAAGWSTGVQRALQIMMTSGAEGLSQEEAMKKLFKQDSIAHITELDR